MHPRYRTLTDTSDSEALTPCHVLLIAAFMILIFFYSLMVTQGCVA